MLAGIGFALIVGYLVLFLFFRGVANSRDCDMVEQAEILAQYEKAKKRQAAQAPDNKLSDKQRFVPR